MLEGTSKVGKTTIASTISEHTSGELKDVRYIQLDPGGMSSLRASGVWCEFYDWSNFQAKLDISRNTSTITEILKTMSADMNELRAEIADGVVKSVVVDPVSTLDSMLMAHFTATLGEGFGPYTSTAAFHNDFTRIVAGLGTDVVFTGHQAAEPMPAAGKTEAEKARAAQQTIKRDAVKMAGGASITLAVSGKQSKEIYRRLADQVCTIGVTLKGERKLLVQPDGKHEAGGRYSRFLNQTEEPNLRNIINKIKQGANQV